MVVNGDFRLFQSLCLDFRTFTFKATILYCAMYSLIGSSVTSKSMTLNDLEWPFCVKIWSELVIQWAGVLAFGENCSEICRATHILSAAKNVAQLGTVLVI